MNKSVKKQTKFEKILSVLENKRMQKVGEIRVDIQSANAVKTVHDSISPENKERYVEFINGHDTRVGLGYTWDLIAKSKK